MQDFKWYIVRRNRKIHILTEIFGEMAGVMGYRIFENEVWRFTLDSRVIQRSTRSQLYAEIGALIPDDERYRNTIIQAVEDCGSLLMHGVPQLESFYQ